jgi:hypothetical protein
VKKAWRAPPERHVSPIPSPIIAAMTQKTNSCGDHLTLPARLDRHIVPLK